MLNLISNLGVILEVNLPSLEGRVSALLPTFCSDVSQVFISDHAA